MAKIADEIEINLEEVVDVEADAYGINYNIDEGAFRLQFYDEDGGVLSSFTTDAAGAYELAQRILRGYDKLEGI